MLMDADVCFTASVIVPKMMSQYSLHHSNKVSSLSSARLVKNRAVSFVHEWNNKILVKCYTMGEKYSNLKNLIKSKCTALTHIFAQKMSKYGQKRLFFFLQLNQNKTEALVAGTEAMGVNLSAKL